MHDNLLHDGNIPKEAGGKFDWELVRADLSGAAFGKITAVYGAALSVSLDEILA